MDAASIAWVARLQVPGFWATAQAEQATQPGHLIMVQALLPSVRSAAASGAAVVRAAARERAAGAGEAAPALVAEAARAVRVMAEEARAVALVSAGAAAMGAMAATHQ